MGVMVVVGMKSRPHPPSLLDGVMGVGVGVMVVLGMKRRAPPHPLGNLFIVDEQSAT